MKAAEPETLLQNPTSNANGDSECKTPSSKREKHKNSKNKKEGRKSEIVKEGSFLLGEPTFTEIPGGGGRWRCVETGQEMPEKEKEAYSKSRACRIGLIDAFVAKKKPPLNAFEPHPTNKRQLICKITGDSVNKSEEHIWKHLNGIRFNNKLAQMELEAMCLPEEEAETEEKESKEEKKKRNPCNKKVRQREARMKLEALCQPEEEAETEEKKSKKEKKKKRNNEVNNKKKKNKIEASGGVNGDDDEEEPEFWMPPVGERSDFDDGKAQSADLDADENGDGKKDPESGELATRTKRLSIAVGPSSFASRKKKIKKSNKN